MKRIFVLIFFIAGFFSLGFSQGWRADTQALFFGTGTNNYMGDLGGGSKDAAHFLGIRDFDYQVTRPTFQFGYRYRFAQMLTAKIQMSYATLSGNDAASGHVGRRARNLSFKTPVIELGGQLEFFFLEEKVSPRYAFSSLGGIRNIAAYVFIGFGGFYYNPKAKGEDGKWYELRPLGTEGQYANPDGTPFEYTSFYKPYETVKTPEPYGKFASFISVGLGAKYNINRQWAVGIEISNRYTSTDYLDDAHDRYFNYSDFGLTPPNELTNYFADRHLEVISYETGEIGGAAEPYHSGKTGRGNPDYNDAYIFTVVHVYYTLRRTSVRRHPKFK